MSGLNDDAATEGNEQVNIPIDEDWAEQFAGQEDVGEDAPRVSGQTIQTFPFYHVKFYPGKGGFTKKKQTPMARCSCEVMAGPEGTVGERVFDDIFLRVSKTQMVDGMDVPKSAADYEEDKHNFQKKLNKIARVGQFALVAPTAPVEEAITAYAQQFAFEGIVEIRESSDTWQGVTRQRNRIIWESLRGLDDPAVSKKAKPGTTALAEATEKIAVSDKNAAKKGADGRTAGSVSRRSGLAG